MNKIHNKALIRIYFSWDSYSFPCLRMYFSTGCVKEQDVALHGHSRIGIYDVENMEACAMLSATTEGALFWTFDKHYNGQYGRCYLFKSNSDKLRMGGLVTGNRRCGKYLP